MTKQSETYERDGVRYQLSVEAIKGGYLGKWFCTACGSRGGSNHRDQTVEAAIAGAINNTGGHHWANHLPVQYKIGDKVTAAKILLEVKGTHPVTGAIIKAGVPKDTHGEVVGVTTGDMYLVKFSEMDASFRDVLFEVSSVDLQPVI